MLVRGFDAREVGKTIDPNPPERKKVNPNLIVIISHFQLQVFLHCWEETEKRSSKGIKSHGCGTFRVQTAFSLTHKREAYLSPNQNQNRQSRRHIFSTRQGRDGVSLSSQHGLERIVFYLYEFSLRVEVE